MTIFIQQNWRSPHRSLFFYTVKNAQINDINILNALNTYVITAIDEHWDTECLIVQKVEASDFKDSGEYCHKLFSSPYMCRTCFYLLFFIHDWHALTLRPTCLFTYAYLVFTLCFTCVHFKANTPSYLFKPVVRHLYSLAFHWEFYRSYSEIAWP